MVGPIQTRHIQTGRPIATSETEAPAGTASRLEPWLRAPEAPRDTRTASRIDAAVAKMGRAYEELAADDVSATEWMQPLEEAWLSLSAPEQALAKHDWMQTLLRPGLDTDAVRNERLFMRVLHEDEYNTLVSAAVDLVPKTADAPMPPELTQASTRFLRDVANKLFSRRLESQRDESLDDRRAASSPAAVTHRAQRAHLMAALQTRALKGDDVPIDDLLHNAAMLDRRSRGPEQSQAKQDERRVMQVLAKTVRNLHESPGGPNRFGRPTMKVAVELAKGRNVDFENLYGRKFSDDKSWTEDRSRLLLGAEIIESGKASPAFRRLMDKASPYRDDVLYEPAMLGAVLDKGSAKVPAELKGAARMLDRTFEALDSALARGPVSAKQLSEAAAAIPMEAKGLPFSLIASAAIRVRRWIAEGLATHPDPRGVLALTETVAKLAEGLPRREQRHVASCLMDGIQQIEDHISADHAPALEQAVTRLLAGQKDADVAWHHLSQLDRERPGAEQRKERIADWLLQAHARAAKAELTAPAPDRAKASCAMRSSFYLRDRMKQDLDAGPDEVRAGYKLMGMAYVRDNEARLEAVHGLVDDDLRAAVDTPSPRSAVAAAMLLSGLGKQFSHGDDDVIVAQVARANEAMTGLSEPADALAYADVAWKLLDATVSMKRPPLYADKDGLAFEPDRLRALVDQAKAETPGAKLALADAVVAALPTDHPARPGLDAASAAARTSQDGLQIIGAALAEALDQLTPPPALEARAEALEDLRSLLYEVVEVFSPKEARPLARFAKLPTEAHRGEAEACAKALRAAVNSAQARGRLEEGSIEHLVADYVQTLVGETFDEGAAIAARDLVEAKIFDEGGPRRQRFRGGDDDDKARAPDGTHLDVALGKLPFVDGKVRPMQVMVGRDDIARDLRAIGESVASRPDAEVEAAQVESLNKGARLLEGLDQILPGRNSALGDIVKDTLPGVKLGLRKTEAGEHEARAHREVALGHLEAALSHGYNTFGMSKDRPRTAEYLVRYNVADALVALREHLASAPKQLPDLGTFAVGRLLGTLQVIMHTLPKNHPVKADLRGRLEQVHMDIAGGHLMQAYANLEPAATATLGLTADPKVDEKLARAGLADRGPERVPMTEVRAGDAIRYQEVGGRQVHAWVGEVKTKSLHVHHLTGGETILGFAQIEGEAADRFSDYGTLMRQVFADGAKPGQKVRVSVPDGFNDKDITGTVKDLGRRALTLDTEQGELTIPYAGMSPHVWLSAK